MATDIPVEVLQRELETLLQRKAAIEAGIQVLKSGGIERSVTVQVGPKRLHWTQRPENKARLQLMTKRAAATRRKLGKHKG